MTQSGLIQDTGANNDDNDADDDPETPQKDKVEGEMQARYVSRQRLTALLDAVAKNKHEKAFSALARALGSSIRI